MIDSSRDAAYRPASAVFAGLVPTPLEFDTTSRPGEREPTRLARGIRTGVPIVLAGSMAAMTFTLTGPMPEANARPPAKAGGATSGLDRTTGGDAVGLASSTTASPAAELIGSYRVVSGDTVSGIAGRYGLSTASVLALNGLSWSSLIFPGQQLKLTSSGGATATQPAPAGPGAIGRYPITAGDTVSAIAARFGVSTISLLTANGLNWSSIIYPGQTLAIPGIVGLVPLDAAPAAPAIETRVTTTPATPAPDPTAGAAAGPPPAPPVPVAAPAPAAPVTPPEAAPAAPAPTGAATAYTILPGDTASVIASRFGITTTALLEANRLDWSSVIYAGHVLAIPGNAPAGVGTVTPLTGEMRANATTIAQIGRELGVPEYGIVIALAAAMQESSLRNLSWGDLDSVGLFQQRPSAGWGDVDQLTTPSHAARLFYGGPSNPNRGITRGLLDIPGWQSMTVTQAAQSVQISAYPDAYARWEASARSWLTQLG